MRSKLFFLFLVLLLAPLTVSAISISSTHTGIKFPITYQPGYELRLSYITSGYERYGPDVILSIEGDPGDNHVLLNYFEIQNIRKIGPDQTAFDVYLKLPDDFAEPGMYYSFLKSMPMTPKLTASVMALPAVRRMFAIKVLLQEKAISSKFNVPNVNVDEHAVFSIPVTSETFKDIVMAYADIAIYDNNMRNIINLSTNRLSLPSEASKTLTATLDTTGMPPADYQAVAIVYYDEKKKTLNSTFSIGTLNVTIVNYTKEVYHNENYPFDVYVESGWNDLIKDVYAEVSVEGKAPFETPRKDLSGWDTIKLTGFYDAVDSELREHNVSVKVHYAGKEILESGAVNVVVSPKVLEEQRLRREQLKTTILKIVLPTFFVLALLIGIIVWLIRRQNKMMRMMQQGRGEI